MRIKEIIPWFYLGLLILGYIFSESYSDKDCFGKERYFKDEIIAIKSAKSYSCGMISGGVYIPETCRVTFFSFKTYTGEKILCREPNLELINYFLNKNNSLPKEFKISGHYGFSVLTHKTKFVDVEYIEDKKLINHIRLECGVNFTEQSFD